MIYRDPGARIGDRTCRNCDQTLNDHCGLHFIPCCPGCCPGPDPLQRTLGVTGR